MENPPFFRGSGLQVDVESVLRRLGLEAKFESKASGLTVHLARPLSDDDILKMQPFVEPWLGRVVFTAR